VRLPLSWLRDFVPYAGTPKALAERLGVSGFEIEGIERPGAPDVEGNHGCFVIGRVVEFDKHPNADRLRLCRVDTGDAEPRQIVCGASNFAAGDTVVVALPGALLPGADSPLKQAKLRGEISDGMMLSDRELGLSDDHDGIIVLSAADDLETGSLLRDLVELDEAVLDVSVESNRGDCLSVYGMAREVAVLFGLDLMPMPGVEPAPGAGAITDLVAVAIEAPERCSRFIARGFLDVTVGPSPLRVRQRLAAAGMRPISNVVDATNYVMHELGNPLHVYDADRVAGGVLAARLAHAGESVRTLDDRARELTDDMLVIADADGVSGIAGIMGGLASEVAAETTRVVLEAACFERGGIQRTSKALGLRTDGSNRWEKGVSPYLAPFASVRAAELIVAWSGASMVAGAEDVVAGLPAEQAVTLRATRPAEVLGVEVEPGETERILAGLGFDPRSTDGAWECAVPWWRWLDATREIDLVEEIGRVHGLEHVPAELPRIAPGIGGLTREQRIARLIEDHLAGAGLQEVVTLSLVDPDDRERHGLGAAPAVALRNPLSADLSELRVSLLPSLLEVVRRSRALGEQDVQIFEMGRVHLPGDGSVDVAHEQARLGIVLAGRYGGEAWCGDGPPADFSQIAAVMDALFARLGVVGRRVREANHPLFHPGRSARVLIDGASIGLVGEIHPAIARAIDLEAPIALADVDVAALAAAVPTVTKAGEVSTYPPVRQDIAVIVPREVQASELIATARAAGGDLMASAEVFDVFADPVRLGADRVSVAVHLVFRAHDRTLTEDEASQTRDLVVAALADVHGAELRG
jgi:phenylalanyl-tRNA synthetase beta chain